MRTNVDIVKKAETTFLGDTYVMCHEAGCYVRFEERFKSLVIMSWDSERDMEIMLRRLECGVGES